MAYFGRFGAAPVGFRFAVRNTNTDKVSRRRGKAFLFNSCSLFSPPEHVRNFPYKPLIIYVIFQLHGPYNSSIVTLTNLVPRSPHMSTFPNRSGYEIRLTLQRDLFKGYTNAPAWATCALLNEVSSVTEGYQNNITLS